MNHYFSFNGQIGRLEFALTTIGLGVLSTFVSAICDTTYYDPYTGLIQEDPLSPMGAIFVLVFALFAIYWQFLTFIKRLNDIGRSRWMVLWTFVPLANFILWLYLCFKPGADSFAQCYVQKPLAENPEIQTHTFEDKFKSDTAFEPKPSDREFDKMVTDLERLGEMHKKGMLTDEEFQTLKNKILNK